MKSCEQLLSVLWFPSCEEICRIISANGPSISEMVAIEHQVILFCLSCTIQRGCIHDKKKASESNEIKEHIVQVCVVCLAYIFFMTRANSEVVPRS